MNLRNIEEAYLKGESFEEIRNLYISHIENIEENEQIEVWKQVCGYANEDMIAYLLSIGWRAAGVADSYDNTLLHLLATPIPSPTSYFIKNDKVYTCTQLLLDAKVSPLRKNDEEKTALILSAQVGYNEMLKAYYERNAKIDFTDRNGNTVLHLVALNFRTAYQQYEKATEDLDRHLNVKSDFPMSEEKFEHKKKVLEWNQYVYKEKVERFITYAAMAMEFGIDPYQKNTERETAIDVAVRYGSKAIGAILSGADFSNSEIVPFYMQAGGMDVFQASEKSDLEALNALAKLGSSFNEMCDREDSKLNGLTPLAIAIINHDFETSDFLLKNGADATLLDSKSWHPFRYLFTPESNGNTNSEQFKNNVFVKTLKAYIAAGFDINSHIDDAGNTLLNTASRFSNGLTLYNSDSISKVLIEELIYSDADLNSTNQEGISALMYLCLAGSERAEKNIITILEQGASTELKDKNGKTALMYAAQNSNHSTAKTYCELISEFGNILVDAKDNLEKTALDYAAENNNEALVAWLVGKM